MGESARPPEVVGGEALRGQQPPVVLLHLWDRDDAGRAEGVRVVRVEGVLESDDEVCDAGHTCRSNHGEQHHIYNYVSGHIVLVEATPASILAAVRFLLRHGWSFDLNFVFFFIDWYDFVLSCGLFFGGFLGHELLSILLFFLNFLI